MTENPSRSSATARIRAGYAKAPREHHGKRIADAYRPDEQADRLLALRATKPEAWAALPVSTRTSLAYHAAAKAAAEAIADPA